MTITDRIAAAVLLMVSTTVGVNAQVDHADMSAADGSHRACGLQWIDDGHNEEAVANTARMNPEVYRKMMERVKEGSSRIGLVGLSGDYSFFVRQRNPPYNFESIEATLRYTGRRARIWVDDRDNARIPESTITQIAIRLDSITSSKSRDPNKGILQNDIEVFGDTPKAFEQDGKTEFLITDIKDSLVGAFVAGYFNPYDQTSNPGSNQLNMLYIDSREGLAQGLNSVSSTLAHEFQHLIHYGTNPSSDRLFNEGCSEAASIVCGYPDRAMGEYLVAPNVNLFRWTFDDGAKILADYSRAMTLMFYIYEQFGESYLTTFTSTRTDGILRIRDAMVASGRGDDWRSLIRNWAVANSLQRGYSDPRYIYQPKNDALANRKPATAARYDTTLTTANGSITLEPYAASYIEYSNPRTAQYGVRATFTSPGNVGLMAILYRRNSANVDSCVGVTELALGQEAFLGQSGAYSKVTFVLINLEQDPFTSGVDWTISQSTLGVDEVAPSRGALTLTSISPNPATRMATVAFETARAGQTSLSVYDLQGSLVRNVVDDQHLGAGQHSVILPVDGLPSGYYLLRLVQEGTVVNRAMVVGE